jgi:hypothetical protein
MILRKFPVLFILLTALILPLVAQAGTGNAWHTTKDINKRLKGFNKSKRTSLESIGQTASGTKMQMLTIHPIESHDRPAILVIGNMTGLSPLGSEAALKLIGEILHADGPDEMGSVRWHILPVANPDGAAHFFADARNGGGLNATPIDQDRDGDLDEDPPEDLNGDGLITTMLVPDPAGRWIISPEEPLLAVKADASEGQRGLYRKETEGHDNDGDGLFNEDGPGGVNPGRNFPHRFVHWTNEGGRWAADQLETRAILEFAYSHPEIAMILVLDRVNNLRHLPEKDEASANGKYSVPERWAGALGVAPGKQYSMKQLQELVSEFTGQRDVTERQVRGYLEEDAATSPDPDDLGWWHAVGAEYSKALEDAGYSEERLPSSKSNPGSVEEWGYYQFGVPTFAMDFWSVPMVAEVDSTEAEADSTEAEEESPFTDKQKALLQYSAEIYGVKRLGDWPGLKSWEKASLPDSETVLVGGMAPYADTTPPVALVDSLLATPIRVLASLPHWLPELQFGEVEFSPRGENVYELKVWLENQGPIPYPTAQGLRTRRVPPVVITLSGAEILEGRPRSTVDLLPAHGSEKVRWLIRVAPGDKLKIVAEAPSLGTITKSLTAAAKGDK